jgi:hypothetical protein
MNIELNELAAILRGNSGEQTCTPSIAGQHIVVLDRGFVYVGDVTIRGDFLHVTKAKNIRYWGTSRGLGQLRNGPLSGTKLDDVGEIIAPMRALIHLVPCQGF